MPLLQSYVVHPFARDIALAMRSFLQDFTNRAVFCLGAFLASTSLLSDGSQTTMGIAAVNAQTQYLLGLGASRYSPYMLLAGVSPNDRNF